MNKFYVAALVSVLWAFPLHADSGMLTWEDCVRIASQHNPDLQSAFQSQEASRAQYKGSYNGILPKISLTNSYNDSSANDNLGRSTDIKSWQAAGNASLDLVDFSQWANIQAAAASLRQSQANVRVAGTTTLLGLYKAFTSLLYAQEEVNVYATIRDVWKTNSQMIDLRYRSGRESKGNNLNTQAQLLQSEVSLHQASRDIMAAQQQLSQALGVEDFTTLAATGTWSASPVPTPHPDFVAMLSKIPQIQAQEAVVEQARIAIKSAHSSLWPTLSLNYAKGLQGGYEFPKSPYWSFSGLASLPIFSGGITSTYYATQAAERSYEKSLQDLRSLRNQTLTTLANAWSSFAQAEDQIRVQRSFLTADLQRKSEYDVLYQSGLVTFQEWIQVVTDYVNFQVSFLRSEQNLLLAEAQWRYASGEQLIAH